ncbi:unnamed protein product, partial [Ectocarpus sp. 12 AP-2014]
AEQFSCDPRKHLVLDSCESLSNHVPRVQNTPGASSDRGGRAEDNLKRSTFTNLWHGCEEALSGTVGAAGPAAAEAGSLNPKAIKA